jgi:hypothetical protein
LRRSGCEAEAPVGTLLVYAHGLGVDFHCPGCDLVMIHITQVREEVVLDMRGAGFLRLHVDD